VREALREIDELAIRYELTEASAERLRGLVRLVDWGERNFVPKTDSTGARRDGGRPEAAAKHIASSTLAESLFGLELEPVRAARRVADVGSGAGFPGLVLAIALPQARVTLIEKRPKKCGFLRHAAAELELDNVEVVEGNVQKWSEGVGACDVVTSRKVGRLNTMVEWSAPLLAPGGALVLWPGRSGFAKEADAAEDAADAADAAGLRLAQVYSVPSVSRSGKRIVKHLFLYVNVTES
jgi:16S rRNA (guanine527-N7)-methyltransferase